MVGIGKAHPYEPVFIRVEPIEIGDRPLRHPVGMIEFARGVVVLYLHRAGVAFAKRVLHELRVEDGIEIVRHLRMLVHQPAGIVHRPPRAMGGQLHMFETAVGPEFILDAHAVFVSGEIEEGLEMRLADQRRAIILFLMQQACNGRRIDRQGHAVHPHAVGRDVLAGDHGGARRHADHVLRVAAGVVDAGLRQRVDRRCAGDFLSVGADGIEAHLVGGDEKNLAAHKHFPFALSRAADTMTGTSCRRRLSRSSHSAACRTGILLTSIRFCACHAS